MDITEAKKIHFIGVGGIGTSALARMFVESGRTVTGSDRASSLVTDVLSDAGVDITIGSDPTKIDEQTDLVIYTIAVTETDVEFERAKELGVPTMTYPEALGALSKDKKTIAVAGAHGKTTTTGMIAQILLENGKDPSVVIGSFLKGYKSNYIQGGSDLLVAESCEYRRSFLHMHPDILVITNIEEEHLDYYEDLADIQSAFKEVVDKVPEGGYIICDIKHPHITPALVDAKAKVINYPYEVVDVELKVPGEHNVENAKAALACAKLVGVEEDAARESLARFSGTWRRADHLGETKKGATVYDDYAHHPDEIKTTLKGFKDKFKDKKLVVVFQPHTYSRTEKFYDQFVESFDSADEIIIAPVYVARAEEPGSVNSEDLAFALQERNEKTLFMQDFYEIDRHLNEEYGAQDLIITMGAGDIYKVGEHLVAWQKST